MVGTLAVAAMFAAATRAEASILAQIGPKTFGSVSHSEDFEGFTAFDLFGTNLSSASGFEFNLTSGELIIWSGPGVGLPTKSLYQNGGANSMTSIALTSGANIDQIQFDVGIGFFGATQQNVWLRAYNNGIAAGFDFVFNGLSQPSTISVWTNGTVFDELRVQSYSSNAGVQELEGQYGAAAIDNIMVGTSQSTIPEPGALTVWSVIGVVGLMVRRRKVA
jgi:hypothetical protein